LINSEISKIFNGEVINLIYFKLIRNEVINLIHFKFIIADVIAYVWMDDIICLEWFETSDMRYLCCVI
jgi:hypothetical protein